MSFEDAFYILLVVILLSFPIILPLIIVRNTKNIEKHKREYEEERLQYEQSKLVEEAEKRKQRELLRKREEEKLLKQITKEIKKEMGIKDLDIKPSVDIEVIVKSRQALDNYSDINFFKENSETKLENAINRINFKNFYHKRIQSFLLNNRFIDDPIYQSVYYQIEIDLRKIAYDINKNHNCYNIQVKYISSADNLLGLRTISIDKKRIEELKNNPALLMSKTEYNKFLKEKEKEELLQKQKEYYNKVNEIIDYAKDNKEKLIIKGNDNKLDELIADLFDRTVNSINKIKTIDNEEWKLFDNYIFNIKSDIKKIVQLNQAILDYYDSENFKKIKSTCDSLMSSQYEFNEYINEKASSIAGLLGTRIVRNETFRDDKYNYIRPYSKTITPFTAEVSSTVFASAENNPIEYIIKYFYPNKDLYPEQIQKLKFLIEELETLKDAKIIIENYKKEYEQYLKDVPIYVLDNDKAGFYSRLGFANIDESVLNVEYKFSYTSNGGMTQRSFTVPMTEETISQLIAILSSKLTIREFAKEQRALMTKKLRESIKKRDNYTCCKCGNSIYKEENLLLEIDHIIPVSKGGFTEENNLQTLCWKCNRSKGNKI